MILVTGGCGYIGSHIVKALSEKGETVVVYDNLSQGSRSALLHQEELVVGDITDQIALKDLFATHNIEVVIHLAALVNAAESIAQEDRYIKVNDLGSRKVWDTAIESGVKHFVYASSAAVYGTPVSRDPLKESDPLHPTSPYGETKLAGESSLTEAVGSTANYIIMRFFNVGGAESGGRLGQSQSSRAIMQRVFAVVAGQENELVISGHDYDTKDGTVVRDFVHVEDIASAFVLSLSYLRRGGESEVINLGSSHPHTIMQVVKEVEQVTNLAIPITYRDRVKGDISYSLSDIQKAKKILGWVPVHTLKDMVRDGWNSYVKNNH